MMRSRIAAVNGEIARIQGQVSGGLSDGLTDGAPAGAQQGASAGDAGSTFVDTNAALAGEADAAAAGDVGNADDGIEKLVRGARQGAQNSAKSNGLANIVGVYQGLTLDEDFAEKAYAAAMASLDHARAEANRTQAYLAIYVQPSPAEMATYPRRTLDIWMVFILCSILWAVGMLGTLTVRDHMR